MKAEIKSKLFSGNFLDEMEIEILKELKNSGTVLKNVHNTYIIGNIVVGADVKAALVANGFLAENLVSGSIERTATSKVNEKLC